MLVAKVQGLLTQSLELQGHALGQNERGRENLKATHASLARLLTPEANNEYGAIIGDSIGCMSDANRALSDGYWRINQAHTFISSVVQGMRLPLVGLGEVTAESYSQLSLRTSETQHKIFQLNQAAGIGALPLIEEILDKDLLSLIEHSQELESIKQLMAATQDLYDCL